MRIIRSIGSVFLIGWCFFMWCALGGCRPSKSPCLTMDLSVSQVASADLASTSRAYAVVVAHSGAVWVFLGESPDVLAFLEYEGARLSHKGIVTVANGRKIWDIAATLYDKDKPLVLWCLDTDNPPCLMQPICEARWNGKGWLGKQIIPGTHAYAVLSGASLSCVRDDLGAVQLVHLQRLVPTECYRVCFDAYFPLKPYHTIYRDGKWGEPRPMAGRSRWDYRPEIHVIRDVHGKLHRVVPAQSSTWVDYCPTVIEHREYRGGAWAQPERISAGGLFLEMSNPSLAADAEGNLHLVYDVYDKAGHGPRGSWYRMKRGGVWLAPAPLGRNGDEAVIANDANGRVYCCWCEGEVSLSSPARKVFLRAWDANGRPGAISVPIQSGPLERGRFVAGADGLMYLTLRDAWGKVVVYRIGVDVRDTLERDSHR